MDACPLIVDLDGTLIYSDMLQESALKAVSHHPLYLFKIAYWLSKGRACLKQHLAKRISFEPSLLPYNHELIEWLTQQKAQGRRLILCTASDQVIATAIADHVGLFDEVMASDGVINLSGQHKAAALVRRFGEQGFDYIGNAHIDLKVWRHARRAIVVNASVSVIDKATAQGQVERVFAKPGVALSVWRRLLRVHQWLKNSLLFMPLLASHQWGHWASWWPLILAFFAFSLCASSVYIANDLLDVHSDRQHPRKRQRPFAAGLLPGWLGVCVAPLLLLASSALALRVGGHFVAWLAVYFGLTCAYSLGLKRLVLVDCLILAILYTLRIVAGAAAVNMPLSYWLLAFALFLFLSLAFVKRYAELQGQVLHQQTKVHGRGYYTTDAPLVQTLGITAGYAATIVLALYLNSEVVTQLYRCPACIWGTVPIMLFWISWVWLQAHRGHMHDDPLVFAVKNKASLLAGALFVLVLVIGTLGWP